MAKGRSSRNIDFSSFGSEAFRRKNPALFGDVPVAQPRQMPQTQEVPAQDFAGKVRIRKLNKTEERCRLRLESFFGLEVLVQPTRLFPLQGGGSYTPDFLAFDSQRPELGIAVVEVKGGYKGPGAEQGHERYARTAAQYDSPLFHFVKTTWDAKRHDWTDEWWKPNRWPCERTIVPF